MSHLILLALMLGGQRSPAHRPARSVRVNDYLVTVLGVWVHNPADRYWDGKRWALDKSPRFHSVVVEVKVKNVSGRISRTGLAPWMRVNPEAEYVGKDCEPFDKPDLSGSGLKPLDLYQMLPGEQSVGGFVFTDVRNGTVPVSLYFLDWSGRMPRLSLAGLVREEPAAPSSEAVVAPSSNAAASERAVDPLSVFLPPPPSQSLQHRSRRSERISSVGGWCAPMPIYDPEPEYSERAREAKLQGTDVLSAVITSQGNAEDIQVVKPLGQGLDEEAVKTVRTWKFKPYMKDGKPVSCRAYLSVTFRLF